MRDLLHKSVWWNRAPKNPTQTTYTRFLKGPSAEIKSAFTENKDRLQKFGENALKTRYSEYLEGSNGE